MSKKTKKFRTEVNELLNLVISALYSNREIFLRELLSNASDAIDKARFESLSDKSIAEDDSDWRIKIFADKEARTLKIVDNGIGMNLEDVENNIGTIARSGTKAFMKQLEESKKNDLPEMIGQFGVGFYSSFIVADRVEVFTRKAGDDKENGVLWSSKGTGSYSVEEKEKATRGTEITLFLKEDTDEFMEEWKIRKIVKQYSDYLEYPVVMDITHSEKPKDDEGNVIEDAEPIVTVEEDTLNSQKAIWTRSKSDISEEEYKEFYKHISGDFGNPLETIHFKVEGNFEFSSLLFIPEKAPHDMFMQSEKKGVHLYVKRVFIMDDCKALMPEYLRFVKGLVDSADLPLNVSREILQEDKLISKIQSNLVKKVLSSLKTMMDKDYDKYVSFYNEFGKVLKEGVHSDYANKEKLQDLMLFESSSTNAAEYISLKQYVERMPSDQKEIYFVSGQTRSAVENSPHLEVFKKKGYEVLFFLDPIDEWVAQSLFEYDGKPVKSIVKGDVNLDEEDEESIKKEAEEFKAPLEAIQKSLDEEIKEVRFSRRLTDSPCCLVADEYAMSANMERIMQSMNQEMPKQKRILELNKDHKIIQHVLDLASNDASGEQFKEFTSLLFDQALLVEGSPIQNPAVFAQKITKLMESALA
ncbi:MAG: molecular chaperone HtpG [Lentisphaeraceae bacterium]|nr:molecular chaperone HtpG [Lentisphaeraceae bacterium]